MGWGRYGVCEFCWSEAVRFRRAACDLCGRPRTAGPGRTCSGCAGARRVCSAVAAWGPYEGRLRGLVHALKYGARPRLARPLGEMILEALLAEGLEERLRGAVFVPVPLTRERAAQRGYNQALLLAAEAARALRRMRGGRVRTVSALLRTGGTPQTGLTRKERLRNLLGAFAAAPRSGRSVAGRQVVLIDDVITTGATVEACSRAMRGIGAIDVIAGVVARTPPPGYAPERAEESRGVGTSQGGLRERSRDMA